jgi:uncharacterized protein
MIIDAHAHIGQLHQISSSQSRDMILKSIDRYHIDFSLVSNGDAEEFSSKGRKLRRKPSQLSLNQATIDFVSAHPTRLGALLWCKPFSETADEPLEKLIREHRQLIFGLKFHPFCSQVAANDPKMEPYYHLAKKEHLPILFHTAVDRCSSILYLEEAAKKHPEITFIAAHMELLSDNLEALRVVRDVPNVYGDTAWVSPTKALEIIQACGDQKLLFGTDNPIDGYDTLNHKYYRSYLSKSFQRKVGKKAYENLMFRNAIRVYQLPFSLS